MAPDLLLAFWAVSVLLVMTPGADWAYAISAGTHGNVVLPAVSGMLLGHLAATFLVAAGVGSLMAGAPLALELLTGITAAYLLWLGLGLIRNPATPGEADSETPISVGHWLVKGFGVSGLNPKLFILFLALLPQFTDSKGAWPLAAQMIVLGVIHVISCGVVYMLVGYCSERVLRARPQTARLVSRISGISMASIALIMLAESLFKNV